MTDADARPPAAELAQDAAPRILSPAARRALAEAQERRAAAQAQALAAQEAAPKEIDGRGGLDPVRYGDWEIKGLTSDF